MQYLHSSILYQGKRTHLVRIPHQGRMDRIKIFRSFPKNCYTYIDILLGLRNRMVKIRIIRKLFYQSVREIQLNVDTGGTQFLKIEKSLTVPFNDI